MNHCNVLPFLQARAAGPFLAFLFSECASALLPPGDIGTPVTKVAHFNTKAYLVPQLDTFASPERAVAIAAHQCL